MDELTALERELIASVKQLITASDERNRQQMAENKQLWKMFQEQQNSLEEYKEQAVALESELLSLKRQLNQL